MEILVTGAMSFQGSKIIQFLRSRDYNVIGVDKYINEDRNHATRFFKLDLKHRDSVRLLVDICKPTIVIYCYENTEQEEFVDFNAITFANLMINIDKDTLKEIVLCIDTLPEDPMISMKNIYKQNLLNLQHYFSHKYDINVTTILEEDNLLKCVKKVITPYSGGGGEINDD